MGDELFHCLLWLPTKATLEHLGCLCNRGEGSTGAQHRAWGQGVDRVQRGQGSELQGATRQKSRQPVEEETRDRLTRKESASTRRERAQGFPIPASRTRTTRISCAPGQVLRNVTLDLLESDYSPRVYLSIYFYRSLHQLLQLPPTRLNWPSLCLGFGLGLALGRTRVAPCQE